MIEIGCPPAKVVVRRLGVDLTALEFVPPDFSDGLKVAMVGRFVQKKGLVDGLQACREAARAGVRLEVTIIGDAGDGDPTGQAIKRELVALAQSPALVGKVRFAGFLSPDAVRSVIAKQNVLLCPSKHSPDGDAEGGMPFILAEAMAMGLVAIGSRHCDMPELIDHGRTGVLFDEGKVDELSAVLCELPMLGDRVIELAHAGRRHIEERFDLRRQLQRLADIYNGCLGRPSSAPDQRRREAA